MLPEREADKVSRLFLDRWAELGGDPSDIDGHLVYWQDGEAYFLFHEDLTDGPFRKRLQDLGLRYEPINRIWAWSMELCNRLAGREMFRLIRGGRDDAA